MATKVSALKDFVKKIFCESHESALLYLLENVDKENHLNPLRIEEITLDNILSKIEASLTPSLTPYNEIEAKLEKIKKDIAGDLELKLEEDKIRDLLLFWISLGYVLKKSGYDKEADFLFDLAESNLKKTKLKKKDLVLKTLTLHNIVYYLVAIEFEDKRLGKKLKNLLSQNDDFEWLEQAIQQKDVKTIIINLLNPSERRVKTAKKSEEEEVEKNILLSAEIEHVLKSIQEEEEKLKKHSQELLKNPEVFLSNLLLWAKFQDTQVEKILAHLALGYINKEQTSESQKLLEKLIKILEDFENPPLYPVFPIEFALLLKLLGKEKILIKWYVLNTLYYYINAPDDTFWGSTFAEIVFLLCFPSCDKSIANFVIKIALLLLLEENVDAIILRKEKVFKLSYNYDLISRIGLRAVLSKNYNELDEALYFVPRTFQFSRLRLLSSLSRTLGHNKIACPFDFFQYLWNKFKDSDENTLDYLVSSFLTTTPDSKELTLKEILRKMNDATFSYYVSNKKELSSNLTLDLYGSSHREKEEIKILLETIKASLKVGEIQTQNQQDVIVSNLLRLAYLSWKNDVKDAFYSVIEEIVKKHSDITSKFLEALMNDLKNDISLFQDTGDIYSDIRIYPEILGILQSLGVNPYFIKNKLKPLLEPAKDNFDLMDKFVDVYFLQEDEKLDYFLKQFSSLTLKYETRKNMETLKKILICVEKIQNLSPQIAQEIKKNYIIPLLIEMPLLKKEKSLHFTPSAVIFWGEYSFFLIFILNIIEKKDLPDIKKVEGTVLEVVIAYDELKKLIKDISEEKNLDKISEKITNFLLKYANGPKVLLALAAIRYLMGDESILKEHNSENIERIYTIIETLLNLNISV